MEQLLYLEVLSFQTPHGQNLLMDQGKQRLQANVAKHLLAAVD